MKVNYYLNFDGDAADAFHFYKAIFGGEFMAFLKMNETPDANKLTEDEQNRTLHIALPIAEGVILMGSDILPSMGHQFKPGNNMYISLHPESRKEADRLYNGLSIDGAVEMELQDTFWGAYYGSFTDKYGVKWMINFDENRS
ncbi:VOC family protein [Zunongwangia atlantica]|uniref:Bleomycin resistance protein n=1 Tax=Zunongwangia atlantica 22II14-10F7 TaxID=1185767 RepID=A0A1Y1T6R7_9FLAO|nr:VOC family protein [Zunongwangia atlantica]ORL46740.1 bleomycin resistance protein [Zunongwangia atlantica 22II14-10F7]